MNRTGRLALHFGHRFALISAVVLLYSGAAFGQLSDAAKKAPNPDNAAIQQHVDNAVKNLTSDDPDKQAKGREDLSAGVALNDLTAQASPQFLDAYAAAVAKALTPLTQHEDMRVRLNAAIANARVAERSGNTRLAEVTIKFINDKTSAVALWGVKAARAMLPMALAAGGNQPVIVAMEQAVQRFLFGPIVTEVYDALSLNIFTAQPRPQPNVIKAAVPVMMRIYRTRVDSYAAAVPPDPAIDNVAAEFLSFGPVWQLLAPAQRTEALQAMCDLISFAGQYAQLMEGDERAALLPVFRRTGAALQVIGDASKNQAVSTAAQAVQKVSSGMDGTEVVQRTTALADALRQAFAGVKASPKLQLAPAEAEADSGAAPPPAPGDNGKAPPAPPPGGGSAGNGRGGQPKSAGPAPEVDSAQTASEKNRTGGTAGAATDADAAAPNGNAPGNGNAPAPRPPSRPTRPPR